MAKWRFGRALPKLQGLAAVALRKFYAGHALADPEETLSRFMAFALVADPPPQFRIRPNADLIPPDVLALNGFQEVLAAFYREANLESQWRKMQPEYERAAEMYESPVLRIVAVSNGYLREVMKSSDARSFTVYVEPPVGNRTVFRNSGDQYGIVVGSGPDFPAAEIQHSYLHFLLDPIVLRNRLLVQKKDALVGSAAGRLYCLRNITKMIVALMDECLIKAVELRLRKMSPGSTGDGSAGERQHRIRAGATDRSATAEIRAGRACDVVLLSRYCDGDRCADGAETLAARDFCLRCPCHE